MKTDSIHSNGSGESGILGIRTKKIHWNLPPAKLIEAAIKNGQGELSDTGALIVDTGEFRGRAPKDRYVVCDKMTENSVWWGDVNIKFQPEKFDLLFNKVVDYLHGKELYVRYSSVCADPEYRLNLRVISEYPWTNLFAYNLFQRPSGEELNDFKFDWTILCAPGCLSNPATDGTRQHNFAIINFTKKMVLIGGTGYTGEVKKSIFSVLNYILPSDKNVLSMHCSSNIGKQKDTAIFFGLSGTGKTTLSSDPDRGLIGDDEHGWSDKGVFNFEGGCYAKCINLTREREPLIWDAIRFGSLVENTLFFDETVTIDFNNAKKTENTRVSYPLHFISNAVNPAIGGIPKNVFFLTCDAFGVLPPVSRLTIGQAMYYFVSGYTAKVAGTEAGVTEPQVVFSACFGAPFLPLHPTRYATMLGERLKKSKAIVWLINTGWSGGPYGIGNRIRLPFTRGMISAALNGELNSVQYREQEIFGLHTPVSCPGIPSELLNPKNTWTDKNAYDAKAIHLAGAFNNNFKKYQDFATAEILSAAPKIPAGKVVL
ncbi:MAG: phosphoenolpyruvate carboxykinase (ATP) [Bacteroidetes bacterium]|nr:phosphoenolpyruvate carboxykinase (ATP) [Bacteroidota bacterium]